MKPEISVVIPAYNAEKFLAETIDSVIDQSFLDWELIVVNDGSTDNTLKIIEQYCQKDNRIKLVDKKNEGVSSARNSGYKHANGNYLAFLDADDKWHTENLMLKLNVLKTKKKIGLVHADMQFINEKSEIQHKCYSGKEGNILKTLLSWDGSNIPSPSSILVKREVIEKIGLFDTELSTAADQEFFFRVAAIYEVARIPRVLGFYRFHSLNMHKNISLMERDHHLAFVKAKRNKLFHSYWFQRKCFSNLFLIIGASWWEFNKIRSLLCLIKALFYYPPSIFAVLKKLIIKIKHYFTRDQFFAHFKLIIFSVFKFFGILYLLRLLKKKDKVTVLLFHRISDEKSVSWKPLTPLMFENILKYILKYYEIVSLDDSLKTNISKKRKVVLTFDDGYMDFYTNALPILKKYNLPALINIVTNPIKTHLPIWSQQINDLIELYYESDYKLNFKIKEKTYSLIINKLNVFKISSKLFNLFLFLDENERTKILSQMEQNCPKVIIRTSFMNKSDLIEALNSKIEIGNHTSTHCNINNLKTKEDFDSELLESKEFIEEITNRKNEIFAFPNGIFNKKSVTEIESYGFNKLLIVGENAFIPDPDLSIHVIPRKSLYYESKIENLFKIEGFHSLINKIIRF